jgi:hypothetical protein
VNRGKWGGKRTRKVVLPVTDPHDEEARADDNEGKKKFSLNRKSRCAAGAQVKQG